MSPYASTSKRSAHEATGTVHHGLGGRQPITGTQATIARLLWKRAPYPRSVTPIVLTSVVIETPTVTKLPSKQCEGAHSQSGRMLLNKTRGPCSGVRHGL